MENLFLIILFCVMLIWKRDGGDLMSSSWPVLVFIHLFITLFYFNYISLLFETPGANRGLLWGLSRTHVRLRIPRDYPDELSAVCFPIINYSKVRAKDKFLIPSFVSVCLGLDHRINICCMFNLSRRSAGLGREKRRRCFMGKWTEVTRKDGG